MSETNADFLAGRVLPTWEVPPPSWVSPALYGVLAIPDNGDRRMDIALGANAGWVHISLRPPGAEPNRKELLSYVRDARSGDFVYVAGLQPSAVA